MKQKATIRSFALSKYIYVLVFLAGAVAFLYPLISSIYNYQIQTRVIENYKEDIASYDETSLKALIDDAREYNQFVSELEGNVTDEITEEEKNANTVDYMQTLGIGEAIGYVKIPKIDVDLPIYRGSSDAVLNAGIGHLERSSLPIGGSSTHTVLTGHRGLPSSRLFRDLDLLEIGDVFLVSSLSSTFAYEVDSIQRVLPTEVESLRIQEGKELCTLVTCDPYMINSHRLLVTGHRVDYAPQFEEVPSDHISFVQKYWEYFAIVAFFALLWLVVLLVRRRMRKQKVISEGGKYSG